MGLKEDLSGKRWGPGETAAINNATVSEGATQSPHTTGPLWNESKEDSKISCIRCTCLIYVIYGIGFQILIELFAQILTDSSTTGGWIAMKV